MNEELARILAAHEERRQRLIAASFPEKIRILVELQKMAAPILRQRGKEVRVWELKPPPE